MSILCHLALFLYSLVGIGLSVVAGGLYFRIFTNEQVWNEFLYIGGRWETLAIIFVYLLFSIYLFLASLSGKKQEKSVKSSETLVVTGKLGEVQLSLDALKSVMTKLAQKVPGVRDVKVKIKLVTSSTNKDMIIPAINFKLTVGESENIPAISDELRQSIKSYLQDCVGVNEELINITVVTISQQATNGKKRVV